MTFETPIPFIGSPMFVGRLIAAGRVIRGRKRWEPSILAVLISAACGTEHGGREEMRCNYTPQMMSERTAIVWRQSDRHEPD